MTYFEKFSRRFFKDIDRLLNNQNRVYNGLPERFKEKTARDIIRFTLDSLRQEIVKIFDTAKHETAREKKKELLDLDKTRLFLKEVCNVKEEKIKQTHYQEDGSYEIVVDTSDSDSPDYVIGFVFDENKKFANVRIVATE